MEWEWVRPDSYPIRLGPPGQVACCGGQIFLVWPPDRSRQAVKAQGNARPTVRPFSPPADRRRAVSSGFALSSAAFAPDVYRPRPQLLAADDLELLGQRLDKVDELGKTVRP